jgi:hypothetical protein
VEKLTETSRILLEPKTELLSSYRLLAKLVHRNTTYLNFPGCSRKRRLSTSGSTELEDLVEDIAKGAPAVTRLRFGKNLPYPLRIKLLTASRFLHQWSCMRHLQRLDAFTLSCNITHLKLIASNLPALRYIRFYNNVLYLIQIGYVIRILAMKIKEITKTWQFFGFN